MSFSNLIEFNYKGIFIFYIIIAAAFLPHILGCHIQKLFDSHMLVKHGIGILTLYFFIMLDSKINKELMEEFNKLPTDPIDRELSYVKFDKMLEKKFKCESNEHIETHVSEFYESLPKNKKIIVVTHGGIVKYTIKVLFNVLPADKINGDLTHGKNCTITCITKDKGNYKLLSLPNTLHLK